MRRLSTSLPVVPHVRIFKFEIGTLLSKVG